MKTLLYEQTLFESVPVGITNGNLTLRVVEKSIADEIIVKHHYSKKVAKNSFLSFTVNDNLGALQLGYGIRPEMKHTISSDIEKGNYCEFDRMWLSDELPKFSESQVISLLMSFLRQAYKNIHFIITYADESVGNTGVIYQATNAIELESVGVDMYVLESGERVHPVSMYHRHKTRAKDFLEKEYPNIVHLKNTYRQRRYLYILNNKMRKKFQGRNAVKPLQKGKVGSCVPLQV